MLLDLSAPPIRRQELAAIEPGTGMGTASDNSPTSLSPPPISRGVRTRPLEKLRSQNAARRNDYSFPFRMLSSKSRTRSNFERLIFLIWILSFFRFMWHTHLGQIAELPLPNTDFITRHLSVEHRNHTKHKYDDHAVTHISRIENSEAQQKLKHGNTTRHSPSGTVPLPFKKNDIMTEQVRFFLNHQGVTPHGVEHAISTGGDRRTLKKTPSQAEIDRMAADADLFQYPEQEQETGHQGIPAGERS
eukprot:scaffold647_cov411-Prasinococcus_capsulatus_cf.AAC.13